MQFWERVEGQESFSELCDRGRHGQVMEFAVMDEGGVWAVLLLLLLLSLWGQFLDGAGRR